MLGPRLVRRGAGGHGGASTMKGLLAELVVEGVAGGSPSGTGGGDGQVDGRVVGGGIKAD